MQRILGNKNTQKLIAASLSGDENGAPWFMQRDFLHRNTSSKKASVKSSTGKRNSASVSSNSVPQSAKDTRDTKDPLQDLLLQRKSVINSMTPDKKVESPIEVLHNNLEPFFKAASLLEQYKFHGLGTKQPSEYATNTYKRAGEVSASIDPTSLSKVDSKDRDNTVIGPYGHFGAMERSVFNRQDLGNTYDGGHLVEHTLLEGKNADVHGNIAPQENKHFNQGLMRGWESIPENLMSAQTFNYKVTVSYSGDDFTRTGDQLLKSGVLGPALGTQLSSTDLATLKTKTITFPRWVPTTWQAVVSPPSSTTQLPPTTISHMPSHLHNLKLTPKDAYDHVFHVPNPSQPHLTRRNSGTLSGAIWGVSGGKDTSLGSMSGGGYLLPKSDEIRAVMYQPDSMDESEQPKATTTPSGGVPSVIPPSTVTVNILSSPFSVGNFYKEIVSTKGAKSDQNLRSHSKAYKRLRSEISTPLVGIGKKKHKKSAKKSFILGNANMGTTLVGAILKEMSGSSNPLTKLRFFKAVAASQLDKKTKQSLLLLENDSKMQD